jgi:hypothetical protein
MKRTLGWTAALAVTVGIATLAAGAPAGAQEQEGMREVASYQCRDVMRMSGGDRDIALAFLHGYVLGTKGETSFDPEALRGATDLFIEYCLGNPDDVALDAMREATGS